MLLVVGIIVMLLWFVAVLSTTDLVWRIPILNRQVARLSIWLEEQKDTIRKG